MKLINNNTKVLYTKKNTFGKDTICSFITTLDCIGIEGNNIDISIFSNEIEKMVVGQEVEIPYGIQSMFTQGRYTESIKII